MNQITRLSAVFLALISVTAGTAYAEECICLKVPMYPVGPNWMHYSVYTITSGQPGSYNCSDDSMTGFVAPYDAAPQNCSPANGCANCIASKAGVTRPAAEVLRYHHGFSKANLRSYSDIDDSSEFKDFLENNPIATDDEKKKTKEQAAIRMLYDDLEFVAPEGFTQLPVVRIFRKKSDGSYETIHAVLCRVRIKAGQNNVNHGLVGVQVKSDADAERASVGNYADFVSRAVVRSQESASETVQHLTLRGVLNLKSRKDGRVYFVRLAIDPKNELREAFTQRTPRRGAK